MFAPRFSGRDIMNLSIRNSYTKMPINGDSQAAFSSRTLDMNEPTAPHLQKIMDHAHQNYCHLLDEANTLIEEWESSESFSLGKKRNLDVKKFKGPIV